MDGDKKTLTTTPPSARDELLRNRFDEVFVSQGERLDEIAKLLVTIDLSLPALYATVLKLIAGNEAVLEVGRIDIGVFILWFIALLLSLGALMPRRYQVDRDLIIRSPSNKSVYPLSIDEFFRKSAQYKFRLIIASSLCFFAGVGAALYSIV